MAIKRVREKALYSFLDRRCLGRQCFAPGFFQHRAPLPGGGSMNTSSPSTPCCMNRAYHGCPAGPEGQKQEMREGHLVTIQGAPEYKTELAKDRQIAGWKWV